MLRRSVSASLAAIIVAALAISGCGSAGTKDSSSDFKGDQQDVAKVIEDLETQAIKSSGSGAKKICTQLITDQLARTIAAQQSNKNCDARLKVSLKDIGYGGGTSTLTVLKVTVDGDKAVASVKAENGDDSQTSDYALERVDGAWRVSAF